MLKKLLKKGLVAVGVVAIVGTLAFGKDIVSYVQSSVRMTQATVKDSVPIEFELRRAKDLLDDILPEIHANIRMVAQEEVEIASLKKETLDSEKAFAEEKGRVEKLSDMFKDGRSSYTIGHRKFSRQQLTDELRHRFDRLRESELVLESKRRLLSTRERSLDSAMELLDRTKSQKRLLASKIEGLESKHRLIKASSVGTGVTVDNSMIAKTEKLIDNINKRLEVAERVLTHESAYVQVINIDEISEDELVEQIEEYFSDAGEEDGDVSVALLQ